MESANKNTFEFNNEVYSEAAIRAFEFTFGKRYISNGGAETNEKFVKSLNLKSGDYVLDVGCGIGGSAICMAKDYGAKIHGVDYSTNMISIATKYLEEEEQQIRQNVTLERKDILDCNFDPNTFDVVYSRDTILHIAEKEVLLAKLFNWLKLGGTLLITDICEGECRKHSALYEKYISDYELSLLTINAYKALLERVGFVEVEALDKTKDCLSILNKEFERVKNTKSEFLKISDEVKYNYIIGFWASKLERFGQNDNAWGYFRAKKPTSRT